MNPWLPPCELGRAHRCATSVSPGRCGPVGVVRRSAAMASSPGQHRSPGHPVDAAVIDQGVCSSVTSGGRGLGGPGRGRPPASGRTETAGMGSRHAGDVVGVLQGPAAPTRLPEQDRLEGAFLPHSCNSRTVESALSTNADVPRQTGSRMLDDQAVLTFFNIWTWCSRRRCVATNSSGCVG